LRRKVLASFLADHPTLNLDVEERESTGIAEAIASGAADVGIASEAAVSEARRAGSRAHDARPT